MSKIKHDRLIKLGQIMRSVSKKKIDMGRILAEPKCGSVGCALGQCSVNKTFQYWGVKPVLIKGEYIDEIGLSYEGRTYLPSDFEEVGAKIFGITIREAYDLFKPAYHYDQKEEFLKHFREFMKSKDLHM